MMKRISHILCFALVAWAMPAAALLTGVSVSPGSATLNTANNNALVVNWTVAADASHSSGANSNPGQLLDATTLNVLGSFGGTLNQAGSGPFNFTETLSISAAQVVSWQSAGVTQIEARRIFSDGIGRQVVGTLTLNVPARGSISAAGVTPAQSTLNAVNNNLLPITWQVTATPTYTAGVSSAPGQLVNPATGQVLGTLGSTLNGTGAAPYNLSENLMISSAQVRSWQSQNISQVRIDRTFTDSGTGDNVQASHLLIIPVQGNFTAARVSPMQRQVYASQENSVQLSWQVSTGSGHTNGVVSTSARIVNPANGALVANLGGVLSAPGSGPFLFSETLALGTDLMQTLLASNSSRLVIERVFSDPIGGGNTRAYMTLLVNRSALDAARTGSPGELQVRGLQLAFDTGNDLALVKENEALTAQLTVSYSGSGLLEGRWQLAEPGSTEALPLFKTLALVRRQVTGTQRIQLESPALPTQRAGKYLLRFCVTNRNLITEEVATDPQCPVQEWVIDAGYQVQAQQGLLALTGLSPSQQAVSAQTPFRWPTVTGAAVYQLQIFALHHQAPITSATPTVGQSGEPQFVVGMVLPNSVTQSPLSELVRSKLNPGQRYLWRITAHNSAGKMLAASADYAFVYQPE
ncbi:hypothetical protein L1F30_05235 [Simiduia sp. 21SJ11W-1]|uniref:hypothetical protein n=1 Tax=Simiduia sp. 21SJ11W-1 TaxID=2909669 RepID=UPI00209ECD2C|nr:hypothetical protein [Simiduia sp. 21SJ11W-1]UTA48950.1 hypothetical protein L1F30_05235 [Simiduia sp. 21SJ11W-1]